MDKNKKLLINNLDKCAKQTKSIDKYHYLTLREMFRNYFSGEYLYKGMLENNLKSIDIELIEKEFKYYLKLYELINFNWKVISQNLLLLGLDESFESPGDVLIFYLQNEKVEHNINIRTLYDAWREYTKCLISKKYSKKLKTLIKRLKHKKSTLSESRILFHSLLAICKNPDELLKAEEILVEVLHRKCRHLF